jgi:MoaA/NifB/PqqE/SkfB family radical SAM enzyme
MALVEKMLLREEIANRPKHWVRLTTACNNVCLFCLDMDTPRNVYLPVETVQAEIRRGFEELGATKVILSGGEASVHPLFPDFIRYALELGYERVQTVTNGMRYGDKLFFDSLMDAGLGEITFSLHGHTAGLHDRLVQTPGAWKKLIKGLMRAVRHRSQHGWPIVNIDVVINKQNVAVLDKIVELGVSLGVKEYDLLHVIPQAEAYRRRDELFYDVREHLPVLQKVFKLNRRPDFHIWTNRFPVSYLEGLEDLIQDPHKMIDEVRGRKYHVTRYVDAGVPLDCREAERCQHCFIAPFCETLESSIEAALERGDAVTERPQRQSAGPLTLTPGAVVELNRVTAEELMTRRDELDGVRIHQPSYETLQEASDHDVREPASFFQALDRRVAVSGMVACQAPGTMLVQEPLTLPKEVFVEGRLAWKPLARFHVTERYRAKSVRCRDCRVTEKCAGLHINMIRDQGLKLARPLVDGDWAEEAEAQLASWPVPVSMAAGPPPQPVHDSLFGCPPPSEPAVDPLANPEKISRASLLDG